MAINFGSMTGKAVTAISMALPLREQTASAMVPRWAWLRPKPKVYATSARPRMNSTWPAMAKLPRVPRSTRQFTSTTKKSRSTVERPAIFFTTGKTVSATRAAYTLMATPDHQRAAAP